MGDFTKSSHIYNLESLLLGMVLAQHVLFGIPQYISWTYHCINCVHHTVHHTILMYNQKLNIHTGLFITKKLSKIAINSLVTLCMDSCCIHKKFNHTHIIIMMIISASSVRSAYVHLIQTTNFISVAYTKPYVISSVKDHSDCNSQVHKTIFKKYSTVPGSCFHHV